MLEPALHINYYVLSMRSYDLTLRTQLGESSEVQKVLWTLLLHDTEKLYYQDHSCVALNTFLDLSNTDC